MIIVCVRAFSTVAHANEGVVHQRVGYTSLRRRAIESVKALDLGECGHLSRCELE
eukprot:COSAG05_NODE_21767_length_269_cov_0.911765_1_plen_54_part_01